MRIVDKITADARVESVSDERGLGDGVWVYLKKGFISRSTGISLIHEWTWTRAFEVLRKETEQGDV